jgi:hypothetical protein
MRFSASIFCIAATLAAAPAFAPAFAQAKPAQPAQQLAQGTRPAADAKAPGFTFGLDLSKDEAERTLLPVGPIAKDSVALSWKPDSNWDVTLDLTSRQPNGLPNQLFPREEVTAGVSYQVTPRFRLGGGVTVRGDSLADSLSNPAAIGREGSEASVRIESAFSF